MLTRKLRDELNILLHHVATILSVMEEHLTSSWRQRTDVTPTPLSFLKHMHTLIHYKVLITMNYTAAE